jgi:hypothetical protein
MWGCNTRRLIPSEYRATRGKVSRHALDVVFRQLSMDAANLVPSVRASMNNVSLVASDEGDLQDYSCVVAKH